MADHLNRGEKKIGRQSSPRSKRFPPLARSPSNGTNSWLQSSNDSLRVLTNPERMTGFWQTILYHIEGGSGLPEGYSGWLDAFLFWTDEGECLKLKAENRNTFCAGDFSDEELEDPLGLDDVVFH